MSAGRTVTLADGREVDSSSEAWRLECLARHNHVQTLLRMRGAHLRHARQQYIADVERAEGAESARRLRDALQAAWAAPAADAAPPDTTS